MQLARFLPVLEWLPNYQKSYLKGDIAAGLTVGIMLIPQGMAYAIIAGLPPVYGLYASLVPQVIYAFTGTARQLAVGPVAMDSLLVAAGVSMFAQGGTEEYILLAILIAFMMGAMQLVLGIFRLGFLVNFLSRPVISGFTSAAALIIGLNQVKHLIGAEVPRSSQIHTLVYGAAQGILETHWQTLIIGLLGIVIIRSVKTLNKKYKKAVPGALIVVVFGILAVMSFGLDTQGVKIVREVPQGLPDFAIPAITLERVKNLLPIAATIALIAFMESIAVAKAVQAKHKDYEVDANQELIALGLSNVVGSFFQCYPTTGGFSRTAVNDQAGAKTGIAPLISAALIGLTLLFLTPLFYYLPKAVLASIIMVAVFGLIDTKYPVFLWENKRDEFWMLLVTFVVTLTVGIREGILVGVGLSLAMVIYQSTRPHVAALGQVKGTDEFRNLDRFDDLIEHPNVLILRYDAQLYFANASHFRETLLAAVEQKGEALKLLILNAESINAIDSTGINTLRELVNDLRTKNVEVYLTGVIGPVRDVLFRTGIMDEIGEQNFFLDIPFALRHFEQEGETESERSPRYAVQTSYREKQ